MEEVGAQVVPPIFTHHQTLGGGGGGGSGRFFDTRHNPGAPGKKRTLSYYEGPPVQLQNLQQVQNPSRDWDNWNPKGWDWDSVRFVAKPVESASVSRRKESEEGNDGVVPMTLQQQRHQQQLQHQLQQHQQKKNKNHVSGEDDQSLQLQLGGGGSSSLNSVEETASKSLKPNKRVRSGSPGSGGGGSTYPKCQVDDCKEDLSNAKDYHRRHKVCQLHSKSTQAIVGKQMQRFCQQCSRFHPLSEFDEGKRSCRRRLAGHNRRRRKTQPEDATSGPLIPANYNQNDSANLDIVKLLAVLARAQGKINDRSHDITSMPDKNQLVQIIHKINSLPLPADLAAKVCMPGSVNKNNPERVSSETQNNRSGGDASSPSTMDLLAVLSDTLAASSPDSLSFLSERKTGSNDAAEKTKLVCPNENTGLSFLNGNNQAFPSVGGESSTSYQSPLEDSDCQVQETRIKPLELFLSSPEDDSPPRMATTRKYFSSESSDPMEERSPSASPPVVQKLFPMQALRETGKSQKMSISRVSNGKVDSNKTGGSITSLELFGGLKRGAGNGSLQGFPHQAGYTSSSGSDHSPPSFSSDAQDSTGRIIFKLFDKDPSHLPGSLRTEIYNWLSHSPSEMESYIRPGCVVLSIYVSMSSAAWELLEENLLQLVNSLVQDSESDFWRNGRFLIHAGRKLASHKDGKIRLFKSGRTWNSPELISVSPLAVVGGQETSLLLRGRNLSTAGKIYCTHMGGYISKVATVSAHQGSGYDEISWDSFKIHGAVSSDVGRCFIEVENGFRGTSFPVIIADAPICNELRLLESEINEGAKDQDTTSTDLDHDSVQPRSREAVMHFLNELGWLFQRKSISSTLEDPDYKLSRFKFLLIFSIERDYCALVKTLLDILAERSLGKDGLASESLGMLSEVCLLNRAVKRRCRNMVDLLLHYSVRRTTDTSKIYIFPPNLCGPGGVTPLHLAASTSDSDDMVDALTSDPQEIGLHCWNSLRDVTGLSPYAYALMRNNHSYNTIVARKLADRISSQVSVTIGNEIEEQKLTMTVDNEDGSRATQFKEGQRKSCTKCAAVAARYYNRRIPGSQGLLQRPYIHSMLAIAAVCVCVCLLFRGAPDIGSVAPFKWENLECGPK